MPSFNKLIVHVYDFKNMKGVIEVHENLCALKITFMPHYLAAPKLNSRYCGTG